MSAGVSQARGHSINGDMDAALGALIGSAGSVATNQLHLEVVEGVDVRHALANRLGQGGVSGKAFLGAREQGERGIGLLPLLLNASKDASGQGLVIDKACTCDDVSAWNWLEPNALSCAEVSAATCAVVITATCSAVSLLICAVVSAAT